MRNLNFSFMSVDAGGNIIPKTPLATIVATQTYLLPLKVYPRIFQTTTPT
jgi:hypothetical protein